MSETLKDELVILITGANRGLGRALVERFLLQPNTIVIAGVRDLTQASSLSLSQLPHEAGSQLVVVKIDSTIDSDAQTAVDLLQAQHGIVRLDVVVANAGQGTVYGESAQVKTDQAQQLFDVNALGPLRLFQATRGLLKQGNRPRMVLIGTPIASISAMEKSPYPMVSYGMSKAAAHYLMRKIHCENPDLAAFVVDPGFMQTDLGNVGARYFGYDQAPMPVHTSADFVQRQIEQATREQTSGKFVSIDETRGFIEW